MCFLERESLTPVHFFGDICLGGAFLKGEGTALDFFIVKTGLGADLLVLCVVLEESCIDEALDRGSRGIACDINLDISGQCACSPKLCGALRTCAAVCIISAVVSGMITLVSGRGIAALVCIVLVIPLGRIIGFGRVDRRRFDLLIVMDELLWILQDAGGG